LFCVVECFGTNTPIRVATYFDLLCRKDSDVFYPYSTMQPQQEKGLTNLEANMLGKIHERQKRLAVWVVGNCGYTRGEISVDK